MMRKGPAGFAGRAGPTMKMSSFIMWLSILTLFSAEADHSTSLDLESGLHELEDVSDMETGEIAAVTAVTGGVAQLPCLVESPNPSHNTMRLVLWYKDGFGAPFYSYDMRQRSSRGTHWSSHQSLGERSDLDPSDGTPLLHIRDVQITDQGIFRCRVDFKSSPTLNARVNLTVIVPPTTIDIFDDSGDVVRSTLGPLMEGTSVRLTCQARGRPAPNVTWWLNDRLEDSSWSSDGDVTRNVLRVTDLGRADLASQYSCRAVNTDLHPAVVARCSLDIHFSPLKVEIVNSKKAVLSAGRSADIQCRVYGSRPQPVVQWWKNGDRVTDAVTEMREDNVTTSTFSMIATIDDAGGVITCETFSPSIPQKVLRESISIVVNYRPTVRLTVGRSLQLTDIEENDDVYFECHISAKPWIFAIEWNFNGRILKANKDSGVIMSNQSLALQRVSRRSSGVYSCTASNDEGQGVSNGIHLTVQYAPRCKPGMKTVLGAARYEVLHISCEVMANPVDVTFHWSFNNTGDVLHLPSSQFSTNGTRSLLRYEARSELDYGTLMCWAQNAIGRQRLPCLLHVVAAGVPDPPTDCTLTNTSVATLQLSCRPASDGGLRQHFQLQVLGPDGTLQHNSSTDQPNFDVHGLQPATYYQLLVYAVNVKGRSKPLMRTIETMREEAERRTEQIIDGAFKESLGDMLGTTPLLMAFVSLVCLLVLSAILVALLLHRRRAAAPSVRRDHTPASIEDTKQLAAASCPAAVSTVATGHKNPDILIMHGHSGLPLSFQAAAAASSSNGRQHETGCRRAEAGGACSVTLPRSRVCRRHHCNNKEGDMYAQLAVSHATLSPLGRRTRIRDPVGRSDEKTEDMPPPPPGWNNLAPLSEEINYNEAASCAAARGHSYSNLTMISDPVAASSLSDDQTVQECRTFWPSA